MQVQSSYQKRTPSPTKKATKLPPQTHEMDLKGMEVEEFIPSPKDSKRILTDPTEDPGEIDTKSDNDPPQ